MSESRIRVKLPSSYPLSGLLYLISRELETALFRHEDPAHDARELLARGVEREIAVWELEQIAHWLDSDYRPRPAEETFSVQLVTVVLVSHRCCAALDDGEGAMRAELRRILEVLLNGVPPVVASIGHRSRPSLLAERLSVAAA